MPVLAAGGILLDVEDVAAAGSSLEPREGLHVLVVGTAAAATLLLVAIQGVSFW